MNKPKEGLLKAVSVSRIIPRRWHDLYYRLLEKLDYVSLNETDQILADGLAWSYCEYTEAREAMHNDDVREKPDMTVLQKRLRDWLSAWRESHRNTADASLAQELIAYTENHAAGNV